jgi:hypothetical protein
LEFHALSLRHELKNGTSFQKKLEEHFGLV